MYVRFPLSLSNSFPLSLSNVEDPLFERGIDVSHETIHVLVESLRSLSTNVAAAASLASEVRQRRVSCWQTGPLARNEDPF